MENKAAAAVWIGVLSLAFAIISVLVVVSRRNPFFIEKKLRLGALLLSVSGTATGCGITTCYSPAMPDNVISIDRYDYSTNKITVNRTDTITGTINSRRDTRFSFMITDSSGMLSYKNDIRPSDGIFDESTEEFAIVLPASIIPGTYRLDLSPVPADSIETADYDRFTYNLSVTEKNTP